MIDVPASEALDPQRAARLTDCASGCSAAARAVSLYPAGHPAVETAVTRVIETAGRVTSTAPLRMTVLPHGLLLDGRAPAKPDEAVREFARLLRQHLISGLVLRDGGDATTWQTLLGLLGRRPEEIRKAGGIGHLWSEQGGLTTAAHRRSIELREVDYERLLRRRALGDPATVEEIFDSLLSGQTDGLDPTARSTLSEIIHDPARLELAATELAERVGEDEGAHAETLLHLLRAATELLAGDEDAAQGEPLANLARLLTGLTAETMADLLQRRGTPAAMAGERDAVETVTERMASDDVATFVSKSIATENGASLRLAEAFQTLAPDLDERRQLVSLAGRQMAESPSGQTDAFPDIWKQAETLLTQYRDEQFIHGQYAHELNFARTQATEVEDISDDPEERIASWLETVDDQALRSLDLQLLLDLLALERDRFRWRDIADTVCRHIEDLTRSGDLDLCPAATRQPCPRAPRRRRAWRQRLDRQLRYNRHRPAGRRAGDRSCPGAATHRRRIRGDAGDAAVRDTRPRHRHVACGGLAAERDARVQRTVRDILIGFGARGRDAVRQLLNAPDWEVRQTAAFLLREFGGNERLDELRHLLTDTEPLVQREAVRTIVRVGDERAYQVLASVLAEGQPRQRSTLLQQLTSQRDAQSVPLCRYIC